MPMQINTRATTTPKDNYLINNKSRGEQFIESIQRKVTELTKLPRNATNVVTQQRTVFNKAQEQTNGTTGFPQAITLFDSFFNGFYIWPSGLDAPFAHYLQNPADFKLANINSILFATQLNTVADFTGFLTTASTDYSVDFYLSIYMAGANDGRNLAEAITNPFNQLMTIKFIMSHDKSAANTDYSFDRENVKIELADYLISRREVGASSPIPDLAEVPSFFVEPEKISKTQYEQLASQDNALYVFFGVSSDSYNALSSGNRNHFRDMFGYTGSASSGGRVHFNVDISFTYSGLFANYTPNN